MKRQELIEIDKRHVWHPYTPMQEYIERGEPLVIAEARGAVLRDVDGRSYYDGNASWWTALLGHNHPRLIEALHDQSRKMCHVAFGGMTHEPAVLLAEKLAARAPGEMPHVFFSDNGSTAVEAALKMSLQFHKQNGAPERTRFVALEHAFHGETLGVTSLGGVDAFRQAFDGSLPLTVYHAPSPGAHGQTVESAVQSLSGLLERHGSSIAAMVVEPLIQGAGGMLMHPPSYLSEVRRLTREYGVHLIVDEVFTGYGRTGTFWASEQAGIEPDILCTAKGLSGGVLPFAATLTRTEIFEGFFGDPSRAFYYGHTFAGNPLGARVALEVLTVYEEEAVLEGIPERSRRLRGLIERVAAAHPGARRPRSLGMCGAVELGDGADYLNRLGWRVFDEAKKRGAYLRPLGNVVYLAPPLNIPLSDLDALIAIVEESIDIVMREYGKA
ncbi:MAG: adenosylmethionine--8-amino-7-oxononanoate transaminase [Sorangiineae bacterium NIC37A_2]|nr:MAG: adenosylmethionine--8-amino-7-oxononanoate transaminase [Sorangiineae bacterium NIC37A_2]